MGVRMENYFEIRPHEGVYNPTFGMIKFGITPEVFTNDLGITGKQRKDWLGDLVIRTDFFKVVFDKNTNLLFDILFYREAKLFFDEIDLFSDPLTVKKILSKVKYPLEEGSDLLFLELGFGIWGFHVEDDDRTICLFARGSHDDILHLYHPYLPGLPEEKS